VGQLRPHSRVWLAGFGVVLLVIVPQLILYRRFGGFAIDRYLLPAGLGMAAGVAAATVWSLRRGQRVVVLAVTTVWVLMLSYDGFSTWRDAEGFRAGSAQLGRMVDVISPRRRQIRRSRSPRTPFTIWSLPSACRFTWPLAVVPISTRARC